METAVRAPSRAGCGRSSPWSTPRSTPERPLLRVERELRGVRRGSEVASRRVRSRCSRSARRTTRADALEQIDALRALITGYDVSAQARPALLADYDAAARRDRRDDPDLRAGGARPADHVRRHLRARHVTGRPSEEERRTSGCTARASTSTPTCTRSTSSAKACRSRSDPAGAGAASLRRHRPRAAAAELEEAVYRLFLAQQRVADQVPVIAALLDRWLNETRTLPDMRSEAARRGPRPAGRRHPAALPGGRRPRPQHPVPSSSTSR